MTDDNPFVFSFGEFVVREREYLLLKGGNGVPIEPKSFRVLVFLLRNPGRLIRKDEILNAVWADCTVSDNSLTRSIATLRRLLGDDPRDPRYIATVQTVGYRFLAQVTATPELDKSGPVQQQTGIIQIELGRVRVRIEGSVDPATLRTILEQLGR